ncbi:MAG: RluA family pseudouridine synthase [Erysipelotrichia bacterium]|nr:RluA family pseudouridine synthase [Erysipelotrichia bacterium]
MTNKETIIITFKQSGLRLDVALAQLKSDFSRTFIVKFLSDGKVLVNGKVEKPAYKVKDGDVLSVAIITPKKNKIVKEDIPLDIVYEDQDILIINKPQGMVVHPASGHQKGTLVNALLFQEISLSSVNGVTRPGIVHRIDKDTSGLLVVAKNDDAHHFLAAQLQSHAMTRQYMALVRGVVKENSGTIDMPIGRDPKNRQKRAAISDGKSATTNFTVIKRYQAHTLVKCQLVTGRTHQIRVHFRAIGFPIEGDPLYGGKKFDKIYAHGQLLIAYRLKLIQPMSKKELEFEIPLPDYFTDVLATLEE